MSNDITTTDLSELGIREREEAIEILKAWNRHGLPDKFDTNEVSFMFNKNSGFLFLTNSEFECAMLSGGKLEIYHTCRNCGHEGFEEECKIKGERCNECSIYESEE